MGKLFGALAAFSVAVAIIFYLVVQTQERHELKTDQMAATFDRDWNEWNADLSHSKRDRKIYQARAEEADKRLHELGPKAATADQRREQDVQEINRAIENYKSAEPRTGELIGSTFSSILKLFVVALLIASGYLFRKWRKTKCAQSSAE